MGVGVGKKNQRKAVPLVNVRPATPQAEVHSYGDANGTRGMNNSQGQGQGGTSCGMGGSGRTTPDDASVAGTAELDQKISALQAQLRSLKAAKAQEDGTTTAETWRGATSPGMSAATFVPDARSAGR